MSERFDATQRAYWNRNAQEVYEKQIAKMKKQMTRAGHPYPSETDGDPRDGLPVDGKGRPI